MYRARVSNNVLFIEFKNTRKKWTPHNWFRNSNKSRSCKSQCSIQSSVSVITDHSIPSVHLYELDHNRYILVSQEQLYRFQVDSPIKNVLVEEENIMLFSNTHFYHLENFKMYKKKIKVLIEDYESIRNIMYLDKSRTSSKFSKVVNHMLY